MLHEFAELLKREPCPLGKMRLLQISLVNISVINQIQYGQRRTPHKNKLSFSDELSDEQSYDDTPVVQRSQLQENAIQLCLDMFCIVLKHLTSSFKGINYEATAIDTTIRNLHASVKLYTDWMNINYRLWSPLPDQLPPDLGPNFDFAQILADFSNCLLKFNQKRSITSPSDNSTPMLLDEDLEANGFSALSRVKVNCLLVSDTDNFEQLKDIERIRKSIEFANVLGNMKAPLIKYDTDKCMFDPMTSSRPIAKDTGIRKSRTLSSGKDVTENSDPNELTATTVDLNVLIEEKDRSLSDLLEKRKYLKEKLEEQSKREKNLQTFIEHTSSRKIELEIRPRFLVPDTNCFINNLRLVENLLKQNRYIIVIPLLVINELDKLSKSISNYNDDSIEHAEMVQRNAKQSMAYLNEKFENRERNLKVMTSQGSVLETLQFRSEEIKAQVICGPAQHWWIIETFFSC
jgi:hypothetical protein